MECIRPSLGGLIMLVGAAWASTAAAFNSGSTGTDGALNPNVSVSIPLPPPGVLNYTETNIPPGVTVRLERNALNTPVVFLVSGVAISAGTMRNLPRQADRSKLGLPASW